MPILIPTAGQLHVFVLTDYKQLPLAKLFCHSISPRFVSKL